VLSLVVGTVLTMTALLPAPIFAQQPAQQQPAQQQPAQQQPAQQPPAQPLPPTQPSQPQLAPAQPTTEPAPAEPQATGPTATIEGAVTNVMAYTCGTAAGTAMNNQPETTTNPPTMPGTPSTGAVSGAQTPSTGQGCSAVLLIAPGVNWVQVAHSELPEAGETAGGVAGFGVPVTVVVGPKATLTTRDNADLSLLDLTRGSVVKVDYAVHNDVPIATNIDVIWHAGQ
jgi:hypothetical protein